MVDQVDGRTRRRLRTMRQVQDVALGLFEQHGFDAVTAEAVARAAGVGVASLFRNFGSREGLVLWDEYDPLIFRRVGEHLATLPPREAVLAALVDGLSQVYREDLARVLRRADLIASHPALRRAAVDMQRGFQQGLAEALKRRVRAPLEREVLAAVFASTLEVAVERWRVRRGKRSLGAVLKETFAVLSTALER